MISFDCQPVVSRRAHENPLTNCVPLDLIIEPGTEYASMINRGCPYYMPQAKKEHIQQANRFNDLFGYQYSAQIRWIVRENLKKNWVFNDEKILIEFHVMNDKAIGQFVLYTSGLLTLEINETINNDAHEKSILLDKNPDSLHIHWLFGKPESVPQNDYGMELNLHQISEMYKSGGLWISPTDSLINTAIITLGGKRMNFGRTRIPHNQIFKLKRNIYMVRDSEKLSFYKTMKKFKTQQ